MIFVMQQPESLSFTLQLPVTLDVDLQHTSILSTHTHSSYTAPQQVCMTVQLERCMLIHGQSVRVAPASTTVSIGTVTSMMNSSTRVSLLIGIMIMHGLTAIKSMVATM